MSRVDVVKRSQQARIEKIGIDAFRAEHAAAAKRYRDKKKQEIGIETFKAEHAKEQKKWYDANKKKTNIEKLTSKITAIAIADDIYTNALKKELALIPEKRGRGRPKLSDEEKARRKIERNAKK